MLPSLLYPSPPDNNDKKNNYQRSYLDTDIADSTSRGFFLFFSSPLDGSTVSKRNYNMHTLWSEPFNNLSNTEARSA